MDFLEQIPYKCPLKSLTGLKCAFCGMTHSWLALFQGKWKEAFEYNLFGPVLFLLVLLFVALKIFKKAPQFTRAHGIAAVIFLIVFTVARNVLHF